MKPAIDANVVVLISGRGSNLQALLDAERERRIDAHVAAVISDQADAAGLQRAARAGVATHVIAGGEFASRDACEQALGDAIESYAPKAVVLAGFMRILGPHLVQRFTGRMINIHPSLLPLYPGLNTHRRALAAGDAWHGATVHFVTSELDGGPRIVQVRVPVHAADTPESLAARVLQGEHRILPQAVDWLTTGRLSLISGRVMLDGSALEHPVLMEA